MGLYLSSAGSGKTYTLVQKYIELALPKNSLAPAFQHIVALTFTNKATEEMRSRILDRLHQLAHKDPAANVADFPWDPDEVQKKAKYTLQQILYDYSHFAVSTIDVFSQRLLHAFLLEVGISGYHLELDTSSALKSAVNRLIEEATEDKLLMSFLIHLVEERITDQKHWDPEDILLSFGAELFSERYLRLELDVGKKEAEAFSQADVEALIKRIDRQKRDYEHLLEQKAKSAYELLETYGLTVEELAYGERGPFALFHKIDKKKNFAQKDLFSARVINASENHNDDAWFSKKSDQSAQIMDCLANGLWTCFDEIYALIQENNENYLSLCAVRSHTHLLGLLAHLKAQLRRYRSEQGIYFLPDVNEILRRLTKESHMPYLYEKVGTYYKYYLLDEFQDTSRLQWESLRPLLEEGIAQGHQQLLVGDRKQSIYRWRGAEPVQVFEALKRPPFQAALTEKPLKINRRSTFNVVTFNNAFFEAAVEHMDAAFSANGGEKPFSSAYNPTTQEVKQEAEAGYVRITALEKVPKEPKVDSNKRCLDWLHQTVHDLLERGHSAEDICILVRTRKEGQAVLHALLERSENAYSVASQDALLLIHAPPVRLLLMAFDLLREMLAGQDKQACKRQWVTLYVLYQGMKEPGWALSDEEIASFWEKMQKGTLEGPIRQFAQTMESLCKLPLYPLSERLSRLFSLQKRTSYRHFLYDFQSLLLNYERREGHQLNGFLNHWEEVRDESCLSVPISDAIQIMTLHKSKGLEFKIVLLPFCHWSFEPHPTYASYLWDTPSGASFLKDFPIALLRYSAQLENTKFRACYERERLAHHMDGLNLLYVACTRAISELHICYSAKKNEENNAAPKNVGELLHALIFSHRKLPLSGAELSSISENEQVFTCGSPPSFSKSAVAVQKEANHEDNIPVFENEWTQNILISENEASHGAALRRGVLLHGLMAQIDHSDTLEALLNDLGDSSDEKFVADRLRALFDLKEMKEWFSGRWKVRHECTILLRDGTWCRPDLLLEQNERMHVVDFKMSLAKNAAHLKQMRHYKETVSHLTTAKVLGFLVYAHPAKVIAVS